MNTENPMISSCRNCLFFEGQGRRGGQCRQLGVPVRGNWKTCSLAVSPFASSSWQEIEIETLVMWNPQSSESQLELQDAQVQPADLKLTSRQLDTLHLAGFQIDKVDAFSCVDSEVVITPQNEVSCSKLSAMKKIH